MNLKFFYSETISCGMCVWACWAVDNAGRVVWKAKAWSENGVRDCANRFIQKLKLSGAVKA